MSSGQEAKKSADAAEQKPAGQEAKKDQTPNFFLSLLGSSKWIPVLQYSARLCKNILLGKQAFEDEAKRNPRNSVSRLFALLWPSKISSDLLILFGAGLAKVVLLNKSVDVTRALAEAVQARNMGGFKTAAKRGVFIAVLGAAMSSLASWSENNLALLWREQLCKLIHDRYYALSNFYSLQNVARPVTDPEERLAREVFGTTKRLAKIIGLLARSVPSWIFFIVRLATKKSPKLAFVPLLYYGLAYEVAQRLFPKNLGELYRASSAALASFSRSVSRVVGNGEAIAAMSGTNVEEQLVRSKFSSVSSAQQAVFFASSRFALTFSLAYLFVPRGLISGFVLSPLLSSTQSSDTSSMVAEFRESGVLLLEMLVANGDILTISAQEQHMQGTAFRVVQLIDALDNLTKSAVASKFEDSNEIAFDKVDVVTPTGVKLVSDLSFRVCAGENLLLTGQNGAGKSSIFRVLGGLWPIVGSVKKPSANVLYLPQKPYIPLGDLATVFSYPQKASISDEEMQFLLEEVDLSHLMAQRKNTSWEGLSLGELQRLAIARLLHQKPSYAILDECTSACTLLVEEFLYKKLKELGIAYITICHRPALKMFHDTNLHLTGDGSYVISSIDHSQEEESSLRSLVRDGKSLRPRLQGSKAEQFVALRSERYKDEVAVNALSKRAIPSQILALLRIVVPESYPTISLFFGSICLRSALHFGYGVVSGRLLASALDRNASAFAKTLAMHFGLDVVAGVVDESSSYLQNKLAVQWSKSITNKLISTFFQDSFFYNSRNAGLIVDPDARVFEAQELAQRLSAVFSSSIAPAFDVLVFGGLLFRAVGSSGLSPVLAYSGGAAIVLALFAPRNSSVEEARLESQYRALQIRIKANAESVAFLSGAAQEKANADLALHQLVKHQKEANSRASLFKSVLFSVYQDVESFSSIVTLPKILNMFLQLQQPAGDGLSRAANNAFLGAATERCLSSAGKLSSLLENFSSLIVSSNRVFEMMDVQAVLSKQRRDPVVVGDEVCLSNVDVVTPSGICLMSNLSLSVKDNIMVTGVNGSGKTAFFRVISGLWPAAKGTVTRPANLLLVPQKPYSYSGTLGQQISYPNLKEIDVARALKALELAGLSYLVSRFKEGLDAVQVWEDTLSLGEQQRIGFARIFYVAASSENVFAVLDECSDAVSMEAERRLFEILKSLRCKLITISKRITLTEFHKVELNCGAENENGFTIRIVE